MGTPPLKPEHRFVFVSNIQDATAEINNPFAAITEAYLLSEHYSTKTNLTKSKFAKGHGSLLISDNGNFSRITSIAKKFQKEGLDLLDTANKEMSSKKALSKTTIEKRNALVKSIISDCGKAVASSGIEKITERQLQCDPDYMIGMEDFTIPVMDICGLLEPAFNVNAQDILPYQKNTLELYEKQIGGGFGKGEELKNVSSFLVLHSYDYDSAFLGGKNFSKTDKHGLAISFGGPLASKAYIKEIKIGNQVEKFSESLPESYLLAVTLTLGVVNGNKKTTPVHILGLGSPMLIVLLGYVLHKVKAVSIDATSPYKDALDGTIYGRTNAYLKMDMYKVAAYALINNEPYTSSSPFFNAFEKKYPSDWNTLKTKLDVKPTDDAGKLAVKLKANPKLLEKYIPYFTPMRAGTDEFIKQLKLARSGSNYWVLKDICVEVRKRIKNKADIRAWVKQEVDRYVKVASPKWSKAVLKTFELTDKYLE